MKKLHSEKSNNNLGFQIPENYFEKFENNMHKEIKKYSFEKKPVFTTKRLYMVTSIAAVMILLLSTVFYLKHTTSLDNNYADLDYLFNEIEANEEEEFTLLDFYISDEGSIEELELYVTVFIDK